MGSYRYILVVGIVAIAAVGAVTLMNISDMMIATEEYDIYVDPLLDRQNLFVTARVTIQNTGSEPLTGLRVNFGEGDILNMGTLEPGKKIIVSPPEDNSMHYVTVTADNDILVSKAYRSPPKMVGMMGS